MYHGVPLVAVGIFADQVDNAAIVEDLGIAVRLDKDALNQPNVVLMAIEEIIANCRYKNRVAELSAMWHDQPMSAKEVATYWIETILKHGNLRHLRIEDHDLTLLQYYSMDVIFVMTCILAVLPTMLFLLCHKSKRTAAAYGQSSSKVKNE